ncbi:MAG: Gfo/Idh/MocA family oxidoreductase [Lactobacillales bacterium]|jgi:predicted dehydrogenase|nr:Gfo/Idh/MocA family oxidoreductase [Lactobacillales bacterium]
MLNLGVIGTNWITDQFIAAALSTKKYRLSSVYSRNFTTAKQFAAKYQGKINLFTDLAVFFQDKKLDVVYIASPNSLHFAQAKQAILAGKSVIVEKPAFSTREEMDEIIKLANKQRVFFFEAARNLHEQSFAEIKKFLESNGEIQGASFHYAKYSSRMDKVLAGEEPNIFSLKFSGGALYDLGVYQVYAALGWFGVPSFVHYFATLASTGIDSMGTGVLRYENFDVTIQPGKNIKSFAPSEIFLAKGTLVLDAISAINSADYYEREKDVKSLKINALANPMVEEAEAFAQVLLHPKSEVWGAKYEEWVELARNVNAVLVAMREDAGIVFAADGKR